MIEFIFLIMSSMTPTITLDGIEFKNLPPDTQIEVLNFIVGVAHIRGLVSDTERNKCYDRAKKAIHKLQK